MKSKFLTVSALSLTLFSANTKAYYDPESVPNWDISDLQKAHKKVLASIHDMGRVSLEQVQEKRWVTYRYKQLKIWQLADALKAKGIPAQYPDMNSEDGGLEELSLKMHAFEFAVTRKKLWGETDAERAYLFDFSNPAEPELNQNNESLIIQRMVNKHCVGNHGAQLWGGGYGPAHVPTKVLFTPFTYPLVGEPSSKERISFFNGFLSEKWGYDQMDYLEEITPEVMEKKGLDPASDIYDKTNFVIVTESPELLDENGKLPGSDWGYDRRDVEVFYRFTPTLERLNRFLDTIGVERKIQFKKRRENA